ATTAPPEPFEAQSESRTSKRISTTNACVECKRRKIRCDGSRPCGPCGWYKHPQRCVYFKPTQRLVPSRKALERLQCDVDVYRSIVSRVFPGQELETLVALPREQLVDLAVTLPPPHSSPSNRVEPVSEMPSHGPDTQSSEDADRLDALEQAPTRDPQIDEAKRHSYKVNAISDDVNGLSLSVDMQSSYVGISSISAALKVIFKIAPIARPYIAQTYTKTVPPSRSGSPPLEIGKVDPYHLPSPDVGQKLIESYFNHVDVQMPMVDEAHFWRTYLYEHRLDSPWLALLNMIMALGSLACSTCEDEEHYTYFQRARKHLDLETFGSSDILMLQAMGLFSGYYLHYLNRPNEANCLMGATIRMATALGLHREYNDGLPSRPAKQGVRTDSPEIPAGIRRRTWWSLFCLDVWGSVPTSRPSLGRMGPGVTVESPKIPQQMNSAEYIASLRLLPIVHNIEFCKLATRIQNSLATRPLSKFDDLFAFDAELIKWHDEVPPVLRDPSRSSSTLQRTCSASNQPRPTQGTPPSAHSSSKQNPFDFAHQPDRACPEVLKTPRAIMHWRYQNLRMLVHRPYLLSAALRRTPFAGMDTEERIAVRRCRIIAGESIADINATCREELIAGWAAVWHMHQAVMVPLVSLFSHISSPVDVSTPGRSGDGDLFSGAKDEDVEEWKTQIETALRFFDKMRSYSIAAAKSKDVVQRLYEASKHCARHREQLSQPHDSVQQGSTALEASQALETTANSSNETLHADSTTNPGQQPAAALEGSFGGPPNPNGDAAMESYWDDMVWGTLPEAEDWMQGIDQFDWTVPNG
ncbi:hypothetical protein LTR02_017961, partial [Friedmanniomyces endolithicus]